jgi:phosphatidylinositol-3-phosphatase
VLRTRSFVRRGLALAPLACCLVFGGFGLAACGGPVGPPLPAPSTAGPSPTPLSTRAAPTPSPTVGVDRPDHVVVVIFENKEYVDIKGNPTAPYLNALMARSANFTNTHAETHPSQPNYLALFSGSTQGVTDDSCLARFHDRPNLGAQLLDAGLTFVGYSEGLPKPGFRGCSQGRYAAKHNPWVNFDNVPATANQPYTAWPTDFARLPTVAFVIPDLCNDMHDCSPATGDAWAKAHLDPYLRWADTHNSRLIVTFDENDGPAGNQILTLIAGAGVAPGRHTEKIDHYSLLQTIETWYGLPFLGHAATAAPIHNLR